MDTSTIVFNLKKIILVLPILSCFRPVKHSVGHRSTIAANFSEKSVLLNARKSWYILSKIEF